MTVKKQIWTSPWGYKEGLIISLALLFTGFMIEYFSNGVGINTLINYPNNWIFGVAVVLQILVLGYLGKKLQLTIWLQSVPAAICSIGLLLFVTLLMGLTIQNDNQVPQILKLLGLSHVLTSWIYLFASLFLILSLGLTILKNLNNFRLSKLGIIFSHLGLWVVLFGANFGSVQISRNIIELKEGQITDQSYNPGTGTLEQLPFAVKLNDFILEEYNPKLTLVNNQTGTVDEAINNKSIIAEAGTFDELGNWKVQINEFIDTSVKVGNNYHFVNEYGAVPAALVTAINDNNDTITGWVSCGSFNKYFEALKLDKTHSLVMIPPEPKEFISELTIIKRSGETKSVSLEVNKPYELKGWKIYQMGYDNELGRWSQTTVLEVIHDPWLWFVYLGIFMMLAGAVYMFWMGTNTRDSVQGKKLKK